MKAEQLKLFALNEKIEYSENESMALHTSFKIGGNAEFYLKPNSADSLAHLISFLNSINMPYFILGSGSNLIVSDKGIKGAVINTVGLNKISLIGNTTICAEAGVSLAALCTFAKENGLTGLEFAYGIPGSVGGALYMNAGAYGGDMSNVVLKAESIAEKGIIKTRPLNELKLGYRTSLFKTNGEIITAVYFALQKGNKENIEAEMSAIIEKRKKSQPLEYPSGGSTFKRPEGYYAAALIDECGLKGKSVGGAMVSEKHAGFVINYNKATCSDVLGLVDFIKQTVKSQKGVDLETEIIFVGEK